MIVYFTVVRKRTVDVNAYDFLTPDAIWRNTDLDPLCVRFLPTDSELVIEKCLWRHTVPYRKVILSVNSTIDWTILYITLTFNAFETINYFPGSNLIRWRTEFWGTFREPRTTWYQLGLVPKEIGRLCTWLTVCGPQTARCDICWFLLILVVLSRNFIVFLVLV